MVPTHGVDCDCRWGTPVVGSWTCQRSRHSVSQKERKMVEKGADSRSPTPSPSDIERLREAVQPIPDGVPESWLSDACLARFIRADGGDFDKSKTRLQGTLAWRAAVRPERVSCNKCSDDPRAHYMYQVGYAKTGQPVMYSCIGIAQDKSVQGNVEHCIMTLERAIAAMPEGVESYIWISDFHGFSISDCDPRMAKGCLELFAHHYPERMGKFILAEAPYMFNTLFKLLSPYIDPVTAKKLSFVKGPTGRGGGDGLESLAELLDEELLDWLKAEMLENRNKRLASQKSIMTAHELDNGVFSAGSGHDCRGPPSFLTTHAAAIAAGKVELIASDATVDAPTMNAKVSTASRQGESAAGLVTA